MNRDFVRKAASEAVPTNRQLMWQETGFYGRISFGMNTFTDSEWGSGGESPEQFAPTNLNVRQWVRLAKAASMNGLVLTVKHYDGFCLWHTKTTDHHVGNSPAKTDILSELAEQCRKEGLKLGIYIALWDRHDLRYGTGKAYEEVFCEQLRELLTNYGDIFCVWLDDFCGEVRRKQTFDMDRIYKLIRSLQPDAAIAGCGPDVRFSGNYVGFCRREEWSSVPYYYAAMLPARPDDVKPPRKFDMMELELGTAKKFKKGHRAIWYPAEVSLPMRKGWFYHELEKYDVKSLSKLIDIWYASVGRNACMMLGMSPNTEGKICKEDAETLLSMGAQFSIDFREDLARASEMSCSGCLDNGCGADNVLKADDSYWNSGTEDESWIEIDLLDEYDINKIVLKEAVSLGQRVEKFTVTGLLDGKWKKLYEGNAIGYKCICKFRDEVRVRYIRVTIENTREFAAISALEAY